MKTRQLLKSFTGSACACLALVGLFCGATPKAAEMPYDLTKPVETQPAYVGGELIFPLEGRPTPQCHASTIVETSGGLVAAWFAGTRESAPDVCIWLAHKRDKGWGAPVRVADGIQGTTVTATGEKQELRWPCWNPVLFQPAGGPLELFYKVGRNTYTWWGELITSRDGGQTWSKPERLPEGILGPIKNKPVELEDGRIVCGSSTETKEHWQAHVEIAKLDRATGELSWSASQIFPDSKEANLIQPTVLRHPSGALQILFRSKQKDPEKKRIYSCFSEDNGKTWSRCEPLALPNPNSGIDAVTLADGRQLLVYNHTINTKDKSAYPANREMLNVALSDDGKTWHPTLMLDLKKDYEFSYPAVIQTKDGLVHITYTYNRIGIKHIVLDPRKLK
jgi:predicted neuraminidase